MYKSFSLSGCLIFFSLYSHFPEIDKITFSQFVNGYSSSEQAAPLIPVLIIGGGPAGLSAALQTARAQIKTVIFTKEVGGHLSKANLVENWPGKTRTSGTAIVEELEKQVRSFGAEIITDGISDIDTSRWPYKVKTETNKIFQALVVIIATGGQEILPNVPGVKEYFGKGIGICPLCDAPFDKGKTVVVFGNNDFAADKALRSAQFANQVILCIEDEVPTITSKVLEYIEQSENISIKTNMQIVQLIGNNKKLLAIEWYDKKNNITETIPIQRIYFALGFTPNSSICNTILTDVGGYIKLYNGTQQTSIPGIFAAGTVEDKIYQKAANVSGRGVQAGLDAINFLQKILFNEKEIALPLRNYKSNTFASLELINSQSQLDECFKKYPCIVLDFYITSCPDCKKLMPMLEQLAEKYEPGIKFLTIDYEQSEDLADTFGIEEVPTILLIKNGTIISRTDAIIDTESELEQFILHLLE